MYNGAIIIPYANIMFEKIIKKSNLYFLILLSSSFISGQELIDKSNYNTSVRIKMFIDRNPALFLDEPNSVELEKIHKASKVYIYLSEINADKEMIKLAANELQSAVDKMRKKKYNPNIPAKVKKNIRYHYFSVGRD